MRGVKPERMVVGRSDLCCAPEALHDGQPQALLPSVSRSCRGGLGRRQRCVTESCFRDTSGSSEQAVLHGPRRVSSRRNAKCHDYAPGTPASDKHALCIVLRLLELFSYFRWPVNAVSRSSYVAHLCCVCSFRVLPNATSMSSEECFFFYSRKCH